MAPTNIYQNYSISLDRKLLASTHSYGSLQSNQELLTTLNTATTILLYLAEKYPCGKRKAVILTVTSHYTRYYFTVYTHTRTHKLLIDYSFLTAQLSYYKWQYNTIDLTIGSLIKLTLSITVTFLLKYSHHKLSCPGHLKLLKLLKVIWYILLFFLKERKYITTSRNYNSIEFWEYVLKYLNNCRHLKHKYIHPWSTLLKKNGFISSTLKNNNLFLDVQK